MKKVFQDGILSSNNLKVIACILMIVDHIGLYMGGIFPHFISYMLRFLGRLSMPIFAFLIVEGIVHTKNINKYIFRIITFACITQISMLLLGILNVSKYPNYYAPINEYLNILYSFSICLVAIKVIRDKKNMYISLLIFVIVFFIYNLIDIELGIRTVILIFGFYFVRELKSGILNVDKVKIKLLYSISLFFVIIVSVIFGSQDILYDIPSVLSIFIIMFYNNKRGKNKLKIRNGFYLVYPVHHCIFYYISMLVFG